MDGEKLSKQEENWQSESDAHTLQEADLIEKDKKRMNKAINAALRLANEQMERAKSMEKVGRKKTLATKRMGKNVKKGKTLATK